jgi:hypothetical protein
MSQWANFLNNRGEWRGSFTQLDAEGRELGSTPSILTLESDENDTLVHFRLRRFGDGEQAPPTQDLRQEYRSLGRQVVFFASGAFNKGSLQVAPNTVFGGEFGFIHADRRHRLVQLYNEDGTFRQLVLIREFRAASGAVERPSARADQLLGSWIGREATISADWPEPDHADCQLELGTAELEGLRLLPDGGFCRLPERVSHREAFVLEGGWLPEAGRMERLIRRYDAGGAWVSASHQVLSRREA